MKICVVGAGAIGASIGCKLAASGQQVSLMARGEHLAAIVASGLQLVDGVGGASGTYRLPASSEPSDFGPQDLVLIAVKSHALRAVLPRLAPLIGPDTVVLPAINGVPWWYFHRSGGPYQGLRLHALDPAGVLDAAIDCSHIVGCVVHLAAEALGPGRIHHTAGRRLIIGEPDGSATERLQKLAATLGAAGFDCETTPRIRDEIWSKLIGNLSFNPVAALTGYRMDQICNDPEVADLIRAVLREGIEVAARLGVNIALTPDQRIDVARQLGAARTSMLQDLEQRRPLELDSIVGAVIELADLTAVPVPLSRALHALVQARAQAMGIEA